MPRGRVSPPIVALFQNRKQTTKEKGGCAIPPNPKGIGFPCAFSMEEVTNKEKTAFVTLLKETNRAGVDKVIEGLEKLGFFNAPASSKHHLAEKGGLVKHSLNVCYQAAAIAKSQIELNPNLSKRLPMDSVRLVALLHDVCKAEIYKPELKHRKNPDGKWEDYYGFTQDYSYCPLGHGEKSVIRLLRMGLDLTNDEIRAIRWHMAGWDLADSYEAKGNFNAACEKSPLLSVLIAADELATRISEVAV